MLPPMAWDYCQVYWKAPFLDISVAPKNEIPVSMTFSDFRILDI